MGFVKSLKTGFKARLYESLYSHNIEVNLPKPLFSFTFDDVPLSAITNGVPILEDNNVSGTFYIAAKLGEEEMVDGFASLKNVVSLHKAGHHIGCHTYTHYELSKGSAKEMAWDALKNRIVLNDTLGEGTIEHFAYPLGEISFQAKKIMQKDYNTLRSILPGINHGNVDLSLLKAIALSGIDQNRKRIKEWITMNKKLHGWLIFFTHGVVDANPNESDIRAEDLRWVIDQCQEIDSEILNVASAYNKVMSNVVR